MPKIQDLSALAQTAERAARMAAGHITSVPRPDPSNWDHKSQADFVTAVDRVSERLIGEVLRQATPDAVIVGEEHSPDAPIEGELAWVVDPLDGTTNYLHGFPAYAVSIAAVAHGTPVAGVVLDITRNVVYRATAGGGAWCGERRLQVSSITEPTHALIGTGFPFKEPATRHLDRYMRQFEHLLRTTSGLRRAGSAALDLADVAQGRFEAYFEYGLSPWDVAAGMLLVREAGGVVTDLEGNGASVGGGDFAAGNSDLHAWLLRALAAVPD